MRLELACEVWVWFSQYFESLFQVSRLMNSKAYWGGAQGFTSRRQSIGSHDTLAKDVWLLGRHWRGRCDTPDSLFNSFRGAKAGVELLKLEPQPPLLSEVIGQRNLGNLWLPSTWHILISYFGVEHHVCIWSMFYKFVTPISRDFRNQIRSSTFRIYRHWNPNMVSMIHKILMGVNFLWKVSFSLWRRRAGASKKFAVYRHVCCTHNFTPDWWPHP